VCVCVCVHIYRVAENRLKHFWHTIIFYTTRKGIKRNGQLLSTEQAVYYLCITLERCHLEGGLLHLQNTVLYDSQNCRKTRRKSSSFMSATSSRISRLSFYIVCGRSLYTHSFQYPYRKKSGIARSGDRTGHGIPDIYENGFRRSLTRYYSTGPLSLKRFRNDMTSSLPRRADSAFGNVSVGSAPRWI
jgi:hypothetical protein